MKMFFGVLSLFLIGATGCQSQNLGFLGSNRQEVSIGYMKYSDNTRRSEGEEATDADVAVRAGVDYINRSKIFPFKMKLVTLTFTSVSATEMQSNISTFAKGMTDVAAWIATKSTGINLAISPTSLSAQVPVFFPITSKTLFTQGYPNLYQETPSNGAFGLKTWSLARKLNIKHLLLIEDSSIIYSGEYSSAFLEVNKINHNPVDVKIISGNWTQDRAKILETISEDLKAHTYDAVFFPGYANDITSVLETMESYGLRIPLLAGDEGADNGLFSEKLKGLSKVYYLTYYPAALSPDSNPKARLRIEDFNKFNSESGTGSLGSLQLYYSTPLVIGEIITKLFEQNPSIPDKATFYEQFNNIARNQPLMGLLDRPVQFGTNGSVSLSDGDLFISTNSKKEGNQTVGTL